MLRQRTIRKAVHAIGIGVHSGRKVRMSLRPAKENTGIVFSRSDLPGTGYVAAKAENVCDTTLATTVGFGRARAATVEHLLSALWGLGIDNLIVELNSEEVPIMDGSAAPFIYLIQTVGIVEQSAPRRFIRIKREIKVAQGDASASLKPYGGFRANYTFVADHAVYNRYPKSATLDFSDVSYSEEVSRARSFGLASELEQAQAIDRCKGSSLDNAVGIDDNEVLNEGGLRYRDEFVKHKLLDVIGDLYLLGRPVLGEFVGYMSGHALNNELARTVLDTTDAWELVSFADTRRPRGREPILQPAALAV